MTKWNVTVKRTVSFGLRRCLSGLLLMVGLLAKAQASAEDFRFSLTLYDHGKPIQLAAGDPTVKKIVAQCEALLRTADGVLRLAVSQALIDTIRQRERAVEIHYSQPRTFRVLPNGYPLQASKLLIPLSGEFAQDEATIFHGNGQFAHGPYRNSKGVEVIDSLVKSLRMLPE